jgi:glycosyltransferase involved in cell wall biosynthesis
MIVKNEEDTLERCIHSVEDAVDEIIIVDTGSTDKTREIAQKLTKNVYDFEWIDDFSAARNFSYSKATKDYILILDADDVLLSEDKKKLIKLKETLDPSVDGVMMWYYVMFDELGKPIYKYNRERLSKRSRNFQWHEPVHEVLASSGKIIFSDIGISHKKLHPSESGRNLRIYNKMIEKGAPLSPRGLYYYARELFYAADYQKAVKYFQQALDTEQGWMEDNINCCIMMAKCYTALKDRKGCLKALYRSFEYDVPRPEACCEIGYWYKNIGDFERAKYWFLAALNYKLPENSLSFIHRDHYEYIPSIELAVCFGNLGLVEEAIKYNELAGSYKPGNPSVLYNRKYFKEYSERKEVENTNK